MSQVAGKLWEVFQNYTLKQKIVLVSVLLLFISALIVMILWANRTEYDLLFANLNANAAGSIVNDLRDSKIPFKIDDGGKSIYVPKDRVAELRLKYAQAGYLKDNIKGYELFENNKMGMTTFMQHLNMKRALEGELMRTINQFQEVQSSRVHLVIPEDHLFEKKKEGSASVVLNLKPGAELTPNQLKGIAALVANSVDGIEQKDVVVMDSKGDVLLEGKEDNSTLNNVSSQYAMQRSIEKELQKKVQAIVGGVVGNDNAVVKVTADLDFDQIERTKEEYDPDSKAVLSQEQYTESSQNSDDSSNYVIKKVTSNYELSKTVEHYVSNSGNVKRLTVAVLVNGKYVPQKTADGQVKMVYQPRSEEELSQIASLVKSAVGYNEDRGDVVDVQNIKLVNAPAPPKKPSMMDQLGVDFWQQLISYLLIGIGLFFGYRILRNLLKTSLKELNVPVAPVGQLEGQAEGGEEQSKLAEAKTGGALPEAKTEGVRLEFTEEELEALPPDVYMKKLSPEARARLLASGKMTEEVIKFTEERPEDAARLIRTWLTQAQ